MTINFSYLANACTLYHSLQLYEKDALAFINAKEKGVEEGFNYAQKEIKDLIVKVEELEGLKHIPIFKKSIDELTILYDLEK